MGLSEPARDRPAYRIYVEREGDRIDVTDAATDCFDIAANSLDFGSGFLSTEEVTNLRTMAEAIGADPSPFATS